MTTYKSRVFYNGDGASTNFAVPFPYLSNTHVKVFLNGVPQTIGYTFVSAQLIGFAQAPGAADGIEFRRVTPDDAPNNVIQTGTILPADINRDILQILYLTQETTDQLVLDTILAQGLLGSAIAAAGQAGTNMWARAVDYRANAIPGSPAQGLRLLMTAGTKINQIAEYTGVNPTVDAGWIYSGLPKLNQLIEIGLTDGTPIGGTLRWSQEAWDSGGAAWRPAYFSGGGIQRGIWEPADEPCGINNVSTPDRPTCLGTTGLGGNAILHFQKARGTPSAPTSPLAGDNILSIGARTYDDAQGQFFGSCIAIEGVITQDATGLVYPACYLAIETADSSGRIEAVRFTQSRNTLFGATVNGGYRVNILAQGTDRGLLVQANSSGGGVTSMFTTGEADNTFTGTPNVAAAAIIAYHDGDTGRSITGTGTIVGGGADYGDRMEKSTTCGIIPKGAVLGKDADGYLTDKFSLAWSFGIKSTDPSYIGGDRIAVSLGHPPVAPTIRAIPVAPKPIPDNSPEDVQVKFIADTATHTADLAVWRQEYAAYEVALAAYPDVRAAFVAKSDVLRATQDVVAKAGIIPCIATGEVKPGGYIVAAQGPNDTIVGTFVQARPTDATASNIVARVITANPSEERLRKLINERFAIDPRWNTIVEVIQS